MADSSKKYLVSREVLKYPYCGSRSEENIEVKEWYFPKIDSSIIRTSKEEMLTQVLSGLMMINKDLGTNYQISKIYDEPSEDGSDRVYTSLIRKLIRHYHSGNEFREIV